MLERFSGYTFSSLMEEDSELFKLVAIHARGTKQESPEEELEEADG